MRFHYGHPDVFDRVSAITMGGVSKACKGIHLSEDIFAGFNYVLRGGESTQSDYIQASVAAPRQESSAIAVVVAVFLTARLNAPGPRSLRAHASIPVHHHCITIGH